ncbi:SPOR domain-containing protein [Brevundimonas bacteroides]|uniref:SPOR domain-containing protein n=1 Tax=Brevundimonas bacteroides TaxID=74311 RepID=UPI00055473ED|nr:SPOR domain-containing protein [Brevundimonas bacteroides]
MTPSRMLRPVLIGLLGLSTGSCGFVESDPNRFENLARSIAEIPLDGEAPATAAEAGLRPAFVTAQQVAQPGALRVEVMDPHALWDARDNGLRGAVESVAPAIVEDAAPAVTRAVVQEATRATEELRPQTVLETLQLGAFSSPDAARAAWTRIAEAGDAISTLTPAFEAVTVDGHTLTRLKVAAPADAARAVCRAADAANLGCLRRG